LMLAPYGEMRTHPWSGSKSSWGCPLTVTDLILICFG
jgi:hypothetical protein